MSQIRVATTDADYRDVNALLRSVNMPESELTFPTLLARQGDEMVGALGTSIYGDNQAILAGPLVLRADKRRPLLAFKLMSHYERAMMHLGIASVILWAETGGDLERAMMKATDGKMTPYAVRDGRSFFIWRIGDTSKERHGASAENDGVKNTPSSARSAATNAAPKPPEQRSEARQLRSKDVPVFDGTTAEPSKSGQPGVENNWGKNPPFSAPTLEQRSKRAGAPTLADVLAKTNIPSAQRRANTAIGAHRYGR